MLMARQQTRRPDLKSITCYQKDIGSFAATNLLLFVLLQKTLHLSQPVAECEALLARIPSYGRQFPMVTRATVTSSKTVDFSFRGPLGLRLTPCFYRSRATCPI